MDAYGIGRDETIYIGDSSVDLDTARNAGVDSAWVSWGLRKRDEMQGGEIANAFDSVKQLQAFLLG